MAVQKLDRLTRSFLTQTSNPLLDFDPFVDVQDPTYVSFKLDFFPHLGYGVLDDSYSACGLFRRPGFDDSLSLQYSDSAYDYLVRIGSPTRQAYHRSFTNLLWRLQSESPWYFQTITGLGDIYKIDPAINFRGKDKILTIECLESVDMRMTFLADLYRNFAFDMQNMREILPVNLRSFNLKVNVLEFRKFNTTFGKISDYKRFNENADEFKSTFEPISVQTFFLRDCEFDFFSESPSYLDTVSVKDFNEASSKFKIKVGRIEKIATYPFFDYILAEYIRDSQFNKQKITQLNIPQQGGSTGGDFVLSTPYIESTPPNFLDDAQVFSNIREDVYPTSGQDPDAAQYNSFLDAENDSNELRRQPMERILGGMVQNNNFITTQLNNTLSSLTEGLLGNGLGNVYGNVITRALDDLAGFFTPESKPAQVLTNILEKPPVPETFVPDDIIPVPPVPAPFIAKNVFK